MIADWYSNNLRGEKIYNNTTPNEIKKAFKLIDIKKRAPEDFKLGMEAAKENTLYVSFMSLNKEGIGKLTYRNFNVEDCELAIFDTKKLLNLINITSGDLLLSLEKTKSINTKLHIADNSFNLTYALADPLLIAKTGTVNEPEWDAILPLEREFVDHLIKAKSALQGVDNMTINRVKILIMKK